MGNYAISVITPFHNVAPDIFGRCVDSMRSQTIGFEKVEWVVVIHNSEPYYRDEALKLIEGYDNVKVHILNNDKRTPSSPRNHGLVNATSRYVAFLDADDRFTPECLKTVLSHIKKTKSQITWFRREFELESEDCVPVTEIVLWDQTCEEIVISRENYDEEKMFSGVCGMVTSRIYDKTFLDENGITFDEEVPFAEDYLFNIMCYGHAEKVCYLPQTIGYHYFINGSSLVQGSNKDGKTLISYAKGYKKVFDAGLGFGFYMNAVISGLCAVLARLIIASSAVTMEDRLIIRDILKPYLDQMTPLKVSKLYSEKAVRERYVFPRAVILDPESFDGGSNNDTLIAVDVRTEQSLSPYQRILRDILHINQATDVGRRYGFIDILTLTEYREKVPVSNYDVYEPLFRLQTNIGETGIITSDSVKNYIFSLGSFDNPRLIPCTEKQLSPITAVLKKIVEGKRTFLMLESLPQKHRFNDNAAVNTVYGTFISGLFASDELSYREKNSLFTAPAELLFPGEAANLTYLRLLFALSDPEVEQIIAPNTWEVWESLRFMEKNWRNICADIASGRIDHYNEFISDEFRNVIEGCLNADPDRAKELEKIFERGFDKPVIPRIWNKLKLVLAFGDGVFSVYSPGIKRYIGAISLISGPYLSATAVIGTETDLPGRYRLSSVNAFTEFVPADGDKAAVFAPHVEAGKDYGLLISTYAGLYRYKLNDIVHIEAVENGVPEFSYRFDTTQTLNVNGFRFTDKLVGDAVLELNDKLSANITDFAYLENGSASGLTVLLEINDDDTESLELSHVSQEFESILERMDGSYREAVISGMLSPADVKFIEQETQLFYRDITMNRIKRPTDPIRPVRYLNTPRKERFFLSRVLN